MVGAHPPSDAEQPRQRISTQLTVAPPSSQKCLRDDVLHRIRRDPPRDEAEDGIVVSLNSRSKSARSSLI
jgi:hypothetical protein